MIDVKGKKVAVLGLGTENIPVVNFLLKQGADVTVCDKDTNLKSKIKSLGVLNWRLGQDYLDHLTDFEVVFRTPGLPRFTKELVEAERKGVEISSATKLFFELCPSKIIGITGTKGKGTTAALIYEILKSKFANHKSKVYLAGNIGNPAISLLDKITSSDWVVLELSSFQLQDLQKSPHIAVIVNITCDHLNHHRTKSEYIRAKQNIVRYQKKNDFAVVNMDYFTSFEFGTLTKGEVYWFSTRKSVQQGCFIRWLNSKSDSQLKNIGEILLRIKEKDYLICLTSEVKLLGLHNLENVCAAAVASYLAGASVKDIKKAVITFKGLEHRLERFTKIDDILFVNDSYATTPEATIAAINSFSAPVILITGGQSKGGDYAELADAILKSTVKNVFLIGTIASQIEELLSSKIKDKKLNSKIKIKNLGFSDMKDVVKDAYQEARPGDVVLFSPGAASFDMFKNASERGKKFKQEVMALRKR